MKSITSSIKRVICVKLNEGEDILGGIMKLVNQMKITSATFYAIGAVKKAIFGYYKDKKYKKIIKDETLEIISCTGNIAINNKTDEKIIHCHIVLGNSMGNSYGGHVMSGCIVSPTLEITMFELENQLYREYDSKTNLTLLKM